MAKITIDGREIECRDRIPVLQAALEAGIEVPHYCYHPALSVVASCRLCLMEMQVPDPATGQMVWSPKLFPSCQTPVKNGMAVRFQSEKVKSNQKHCMEYFLLNHPLDCPTCDQAGECYLQDYSQRFGNATSRMIDEKTANPKKNIGPQTLLYQDRCVMCTRCVRFTKEVSGTNELCVVSRADRSEIDVFPGLPLDNLLQGNVVDLCPVGALLDKDFLFKQRVWHLQGADSICPNCSAGCAIRIDHNENRVYRLKPRYNPGVNDWWICDEGRFGWKYIADESRITTPLQRRGMEESPIRWEDLPQILEYRFSQHAREDSGDRIAAVLSPMMACEEVWLLAGFLRRVAPQSMLVPGFVPRRGDDQVFPQGAQAEKAKFVIRAEKCPNARGVELVCRVFGGASATFETFLDECKAGKFAAVWVVGGYPFDWTSKEMAAALGGVSLLVVQDILPNALTRAATILLPQCAWCEREGSFMNQANLLQTFAWATKPPEGARRDGQFLLELAGHNGLYTGQRVREMMARQSEAFGRVAESPAAPVHQH
jgi:NADH-quinone oxidoreductase subunit G